MINVKWLIVNVGRFHPLTIDSAFSNFSSVNFIAYKICHLPILQGC